VKTLAALAAGCLTLTGSAALADAPRTQPQAGEACTDNSPPPVKIRFQNHRVVRLKVSNPCRDRVVFVSWFLEQEHSESDFDGLVVFPGIHFDWSKRDLDRVSAASGLGLSGDLYAAGFDVTDYCWDTDGTIFRVTADGVSAGEGCPSPPDQKTG